MIDLEQLAYSVAKNASDRCFVDQPTLVMTDPYKALQMGVLPMPMWKGSHINTEEIRRSTRKAIKAKFVH